MSLDDFKNPMLDAISNSIDEALEGSYTQGRKDAIDEVLELLRSSEVKYYAWANWLESKLKK